MTRQITIEKLIEWTYAEECAHKAGEVGRGFDGPGHDDASSNMGALLNIAALGCMVDGEGTCDHQRKGYDIHPDAQIVHNEVQLIPDTRAKQLIIMHGILRNQPDPLAEEHVYIDPRAATGEMRIRMVYRDAGNSDEPIASRIPWLGGDLGLIVEARVDYALWRTAINQVQARLVGALSLFEPTPCTLPAEPWNHINRARSNNPQMWETAENRHSLL